MKLQQVAIRMGEVIPTQPYANVKPEVEVCVLVEDGDTVDSVINYAKGLAKAALGTLKHEMLGIKELPSPQQQPVTVGGSWPVVAATPKIDNVTF